jgi:cytochrome c55X
MRAWLVMLGLSLCALPQAWAEQRTEPGASRQLELRHLLRQDCGSCHGLMLKGGLGPPLVQDSLAGKPAAFLRQTILDGRPGTAMPPWRPLLSEADVTWLVERLLDGEGLK